MIIRRAVMHVEERKEYYLGLDSMNICPTCHQTFFGHISYYEIVLKNSRTDPLFKISRLIVKHQITDFIKWVEPRNVQQLLAPY